MNDGYQLTEDIPDDDDYCEGGIRTFQVVQNLCIDAQEHPPDWECKREILWALKTPLDGVNLHWFTGYINRRWRGFV